MADKQINLKVVADGEYSDIETLEKKISKLKNEKLHFRIEADNNKIMEIDEKIANLKNEIKSLSSTPLDVKTNMNEINQLVNEINKLEAEKVDIQIDIEQAELEQVKSEIQALDNENIDIQLNNQSAMEALSQIGDGFDRLKTGASEIGQVMGGLLESAGKQETNKSFLEHALNNDVKLAEEKMGQINSIVQDLPGDDTAVQGLLSQAIAKDASLTQDTLKDIGVAYADYASAMSFYGKSGIEAQQDMTNYILAGNTAELERSPILSSHIDKLKQATTVQERAKVLQEALNEEHWGGMSQQDTFNNKLETFNGMLERGRYNLGGMFQEGAKSGMEFLLQLDATTGGLVGVGIAMAEFASPMVDVVMGLSQIATGINALKDLDVLVTIKDKFNNIKSTISDVKNAVVDFGGNVKSTLTTALDSFKNGFDIARQKALQFASDLRSSVGNALMNLKTRIVEVAQSIKTTFVNALRSMATYIQSTVIPAVKNAVLALKELAVSVLKAGYNALKTVVMWVAQKVALIASTVAEYGLAVAQAVLNAVMSMNPIMLVVIALMALVAGLVWAYNNVDWFREMVNNAWLVLQEVGAYIVGSFLDAVQNLGNAFNTAGQLIQSAIQNAVDFVIGALTNLWNYTMTLGGLIPQNAQITGNSVIDSVLKVLAFMWTLPAQISMVFINIIAKALGFGDNFSQNMIKGAVNAVNGFMSSISTLPSKLWGELSEMLSMAQNFAMQIADILTFGGASMVMGWITGSGESSPGFMYDALVGELTAMANAPSEFLMGLVTSITDFGGQMAEALTLALFGVNFEDLQNNILLLWSSLDGLWNYILGFSNNVTNTVSILNAYVMNAVNILLSYISMLPATLSGILNNLISSVISFAGGFANNLMNAGRNAVNHFTSAIRGLPDGFRSELNQIISDATNFVGNIGSILYNAGVNAIQNFLSGLDRHSPGKMQREFIAEITEMGDRVPNESKGLIRNVGLLGSNIVDEFGNPNLSLDFNANNDIIDNLTAMNNNNIGGAGVFRDLILNIGTVDSEERVNEIIEIIQKELNWNNITAGRTV